MGRPKASTTTPAFSALTWFDRPYSNPLELMYVPATDAPNLLDRYSIVTAASDPYSGNELPMTDFGHLSNYFYSDPTSSEATHLYRIFDYIETPSPYRGTSTWFDPGANYELDSTYGYHDLSNFREPGRINLNTANDNAVWYALTRRFPEFDTSTAAMNMADNLSLIHI